MEETLPLHAEGLARMLRWLIFDAEDAAAFLGIQPESLATQVYRGRIASVRYGGHRYFARGDLREYREFRERGRGSHLEPARTITVPRLGQIG